MQLFLKILCEKANSVDPDQTAPSGAVWSGSALFVYAILSAILVYEILGHILYSNDSKGNWRNQGFFQLTWLTDKCILLLCCFVVFFLFLFFCFYFGSFCFFFFFSSFFFRVGCLSWLVLTSQHP